MEVEDNTAGESTNALEPIGNVLRVSCTLLFLIVCSFKGLKEITYNWWYFNIFIFNIQSKSQQRPP